MSQETKFVIDSNVLIQAKNRYYAFDVCTGFWNAIDSHASSGKIVTVEPVLDEILDGDDNLSEWLDKRRVNHTIIDISDKGIQDSYSTLINWVFNSSQFQDAAKSEYADSADGWIMAYAHAYNHKVVTHESYHKNVKKRVPIPNVCKEFNIKYTNTFEMLRSLSIEFVCAN